MERCDVIGRSRAFWLSYWLWMIGGAAYAIVAVAALFVIDWDGISRALNLNQGVVSITIWLLWSASLALFGALPIATAFEFRKLHRVSRGMALVVAVCAAVALPVAGWYGLVLAGVYGSAALCLTSASVARLLNSQEGLRGQRKKRVSIAYVLLIAGGGLLGLHNYYLGRAWRGVVCLGLLLWGTVSWPTNYAYIILGALAAMNVWDAFRLRLQVAAEQRSQRPKG